LDTNCAVPVFVPQLSVFLRTLHLSKLSVSN
jgi:hypothetical protein